MKRLRLASGLVKRFFWLQPILWLAVAPNLLQSGEDSTQYTSKYAKGLIPPPFESHQISHKIPALFGFPTRFDWREQGKITSVKNQSTCGACYAFAYLGEIEAQLLRAGEGEFDFSENNVKECEWFNRTGRYPSGCGGGTAWRVVNLLSERGTVLEECDGYEPYDSYCKLNCPYIKTVLNWRVFSLLDVPPADVVKHYVYNHGPVFAAIYAGRGDQWEAEFENYDGSYTLYYTGPGKVNHAILIVGWDDTLSHAGGSGAWIAKNSWGTEWGGTCGYGEEKGYFTIAYGSASIGAYASFTTEWRDFDRRDIVLIHDEAGYGDHFGLGSRTAWGMNVFTPPVDAIIERVELWTTDAVETLGIYVYDSFAGGKPRHLLASRIRSDLSELGYVSVALSESVKVIANDPIYVVARIKNVSFDKPLAYDPKGLGPVSGLSYVSTNGDTWQTFESGDLGIRVRLKDIYPPDTVSWFRAIPLLPSQNAIKLVWLNPPTNDFAFTRIRYSDEHFPQDPDDGYPVDGVDGVFFGSAASIDSFIHTAPNGSAGFFYSAFAYDARGNHSKRVVAFASLIDTIPPALDLSVFQNPYLTNHLDIYVKASEPILDTSLVVKANQARLEPILVDWEESLYRCDYDLYQSGILYLEAYAKDLSLNIGHVDREFGVTKLGTQGGLVASPDGKAQLEIPPNAIGREVFVLSDAELAKNGSSKVYGFYPEWISLSKQATLLISLEDYGEDDLAILRLEKPSPETLASYIDLERRSVIAYINRLGRYALVKRGWESQSSSCPFSLHVNPNPFVASTSILLEMATEAQVDLRIYSVDGRLVSDLHSGKIGPGRYRFEWDGTTQSGDTAGAGLYVCSLRSNLGRINRKIVHLR